MPAIKGGKRGARYSSSMLFLGETSKTFVNAAIRLEAMSCIRKKTG